MSARGFALLDLIDVHRLQWDPEYDRPRATRTVEDIDTFELHHTGAVGPRSMSYEDKKRWIESIRDYHVITKGWSDIFYHVIVFADGEVWGGRTADRTSQGDIPERLTVHIPGDNPEITRAQQDSLLEIARWCTSSPENLTWHSARSATACPGPNGIVCVETLRARLNEGAPVASWNDPRPPEALGHLADAKAAASKGFINNDSPERAASRSVLGVVANRIDDAAIARESALKAEAAALRTQANSLNAVVNKLKADLAAATARIEDLEETNVIELDEEVIEFIVLKLIERLQD